MVAPPAITQLFGCEAFMIINSDLSNSHPHSACCIFVALNGVGRLDLPGFSAVSARCQRRCRGTASAGCLGAVPAGRRDSGRLRGAPVRDAVLGFAGLQVSRCDVSAGAAAAVLLQSLLFFPRCAPNGGASSLRSRLSAGLQNPGQANRRRLCPAADMFAEAKPPDFDTRPRGRIRQRLIGARLPLYRVRDNARRRRPARRRPPDGTGRRTATCGTRRCRPDALRWRGS